MTAIFVQDGFEFTSETKKALTVSLCLHIGIVVLGIVGLPYIAKPPAISQPIAIEIINPADITTTNKPPSKSKLKPAVEEPKKAPKVEKKVVAPPKVEAKEPPKIKPLEKSVEKKETVKPKSNVPPLPTEKLEKPKPEKKVEDKEEAVQQEDPLESLMKNLQDSEEFSDEDGAEKLTEAIPDAPFSEVMTQNEWGTLSHQLEGCFEIPIGAANIQNMVVNVRIWINPDRTVRRAQAEDRMRMAADPAFRALAESAERSFSDPNCRYLDIPMDNYNHWKDHYIVVPFDPSHVT